MPVIKQKQSLNQSLSPQQILQTLILQLNTNSLEDKVFEELESNPLLEHSDGSDQEESFDSKDEIDYEDDPDEYEPHNIYSNESIKDDILNGFIAVNIMRFIFVRIIFIIYLIF